MCGILGLYNLDAHPIDPAALQRMATLLRHRGPDDEGFLLVDTHTRRVALCRGTDTDVRLDLPALADLQGEAFDLAFGFRRLAILDLSPAGHQPMSAAEDKLWLVFNGEIYNYLELRAELQPRGYVFRTGSDTEVILAAYQHWGIQCLSHFNGMWAFALLDLRKDEPQLFLARDRMGVKPLYYTWDGRRFAFASEIKALWRSGLVPAEPDPLAVATYIAGSHRPDELETTLLRGVRQLPPAHVLSLAGSRTPAVQRYWQLRTTPALGEGEPVRQSVERFRVLLTDAIRLRLHADVPIGTCLSGGLDSSTIVCIANQLLFGEQVLDRRLVGERQKTFSACYDNSPADERPFIESVIEATGAARHFVFPSADSLAEDLEDLVYFQDEPFGSTSIYAQWCIMRRVRAAGVVVLLDGQGADEMLAGYLPFIEYLRQVLTARGPAAAWSELQAVRRVHGQSYRALPSISAALLPAWLRQRVRSQRRASVDFGLAPDLHQALLSSPPVSAADASAVNLNELLLEQQLFGLPELLRYEDRNSMAFSIEARTPFVDYRLVEFAFGLPANYKIHDGWTKWIMRQAIDGLVPPSITWRRDKKGFETPEAEWLRYLVRAVPDLSVVDAHAADYLDPSVAARIRSADFGHMTRDQLRQTWRWINLLTWLRQLRQTTK